ETDWTLTQSASGNRFDTGTELLTIKNLSGPGLVSVKRSSGMETITRWEAGSFDRTITLNGHRVVDGRSLSDVVRRTGFKTNRAGDFVYLKTPKGPKARVQLYLNDTQIHDWPRLSVVHLLSFKGSRITVSIFDRDRQSTEFWTLNTSLDGPVVEKVVRIGQVEGCAVLKPKVTDDGMLLQLHCDADNGSDLYRLNVADGRPTPLYTGGADALLANGVLPRSILKQWRAETADAVPVLLVDGNDNARSLFHATTGSLLKGFGEPMALASDAAGKQSWSQSYRTRSLATLYARTGHSAFSALTRMAMARTLRQRNGDLGIKGDANPQCAWASRIYSKDKTTPVSLLINQAMIAGALLSSCDALGDACSADLRRQVKDNAECLISAYERDFDQSAQLYRIQRGVLFRYDGLWAPWNWQMSWAAVLAASDDAVPGSGARAMQLVNAFTDTWTRTDNGALWRYWPDQYYAGWSKDLGISVHRPAQRVSKSPRYEDLNHAGISLLGLQGAGAVSDLLDDDQKAGVRTRLTTLLESGTVLPRDMDGAGPTSPRWMPGAGWDAFADDAMRHRYARLMPGAHSSDQHLTYARLYNPDRTFKLTLTLAHCTREGCDSQKEWSYGSADAFLSDNPLFTFSPSNPM
ncbi:MAG: hypothetical protein AAFY01_12060, partial [Pseudomonadota bacterium]